MHFTTKEVQQDGAAGFNFVGVRTVGCSIQCFFFSLDQ